MNQEAGIITLDALAQRVAHECLREYCQEVVGQSIRGQMIRLVKEEIESGKDEKKRKHDEFFGALFKAIAPYERKFKAMIGSIWDEEERIIIANLKKMKKSWMTKDTIDHLLYPVGVFEKKIADGTTQIFIEVMSSEGKRIVALYDLDVVFDIGNPGIQEWLADYTPKFSSQLEAVNVAKLRVELSEGIKAGESIRELAKRVNETYANWNRYRSEMIARSETIRASNAAAKETYRQSGVVKKIIWLTNLDDRTCSWCEDLDGKVIDIEDNFFDKGDTYSVEGEDGRQSMNLDYTDVGYPPLHADCLLPGSVCKPAGHIIAGLRVGYDGQAIEFILSDGSRFSVTENHMLLTPNGFAAAKFLCEGDDILNCPEVERVSFADPNYDDCPTPIEEIISALAEKPGMITSRVPMASEYLHGDGRFCYGDIQVIRTDCFLGNTAKAMFCKPYGQLDFVSSDIHSKVLLGGSGFAAMLKRLASAADGIVGGFRKTAPFFLRRAGHADEHGLTSVSGFNPSPQKPLSDSAPGNIEVFRQFLLGFSGLITTHKIVNVNKFPFHGFVYDLQTSTSLYIIGNTLSSNCRCSVGPLIED